MSQKNSKTSRSNKLLDSKDVVFIWTLLKKNFLILLFVPILTYIIGYIYVYRMTETYGAKSQLLLQSNETYEYQDPIYKGLGAYGAFRDVRNQVRILESNDLIEEVIIKMNCNTSYYVVGRLNKKEVFGTLPFIADVSVIDSTCFEIPVSVKVLDQEKYVLSYIKSETETEVVGVFEQPLVTSEFVLTLKRSYPFTAENIGRVTSSEYEIIFHSNNHMISKFKSNLVIENIENTSILELTVTDEIGARAKVFLDTLASVFVDFSIESQLEVNQNTLDNIDKQIKEVSLILKGLEDELILYKNDNSILQLSMEENEYFLKFVDYTKLNRELEHERSSIVSLQEYILKSNDEHILPPSFYILDNDVYLKTTIQDIYSLQLELNTKSNSQTQINPNIERAKSQLANLKKDVLIYLTNLLGALDDEIALTQSYVDEYRSKMKRIPFSVQGVANIQRELDVNNKMYLFLLEKKTSTQIARAGIIPQVKVIEKARNLGVVAPDKSKIKNLFLLAGVLIGFFIAFINKVFFERIQNVNELARETTLNIIGGIPHVASEVRIAVNDMPKSHITESFRTIRTNISFLGDSVNKSKAILVSSFFPGEGKTFTSSNLATILAKGDKNVLIMDFDLHKPKIHKMFDIENTLGISTFLIGKSDLSSIVHKDVFESLDIITAGALSPNPSELILKNRVTEIIDWAKANYDFVIIDTPPFGLLNDALELAKLVNVFLVVSNAKVLKKRGLSTIEEYLERFENVDKGIILNGIKQSKLSYYYAKYSYKYSYGYAYGYGYGYGAGYGYEYSDKE